MAKHKRKKRPAELWAARDEGSDDVYFFSRKPTLDHDDKCGECGRTIGRFSATGGTEGEAMCEDGFTRVTGISLAQGQAVQLKVMRVEETK